MLSDSDKKNAAQRYGEILVGLQELSKSGMSVENWCRGCKLIECGIKVATFVHEPDLSTLPFYRFGLQYLAREPKEMSLSRPMELMNDEDEGYADSERNSIAAAFAGLAKKLMNWAEDPSRKDDDDWNSLSDNEIRNRIEWMHGEEDRLPYFVRVRVLLGSAWDSLHFFENFCDGNFSRTLEGEFCEWLFVRRSSSEEWRFQSGIIERLHEGLTPAGNSCANKQQTSGAETVAACLPVQEADATSSAQGNQAQLQALRDGQQQIEAKVDLTAANTRAILYEVTSGGQGKPLSNKRQAGAVRREMVQEGYKLILSKSLSDTDAAAEMIQAYKGRRGAYSENEQGALRKAIERERLKHGIERTTQKRGDLRT